MTPTAAITALPGLVDQLRARIEALATATDETGQQWQRLGSVGGQRDDHAAQLLEPVRQRLADLERFAGNCRKQIETLQADPFGRKAG